MLADDKGNGYTHDDLFIPLTKQIFNVMSFSDPVSQH